MNIYRSKRDNKLYILSKNSPPKYTGSWIECMEYKNYPTGKWEKIPTYKINDFVKIAYK